MTVWQSLVNICQSQRKYIACQPIVWKHQVNGWRSKVKRLGLLSIWDGLDRSGELPPWRWVTHRGVDFPGQLGQNEWGGNNSFLSPISGGFAPASERGQKKGLVTSSFWGLHARVSLWYHTTGARYNPWIFCSFCLISDEYCICIISTLSRLSKFSCALPSSLLNLWPLLL